MRPAGYCAQPYEHFTLQTARAAAINQANGRTAAYLGVDSSSLIALAFVGQIAGVDIAFRVFGLLLLVPLAFVGVAAFARTLQLAVEEAVYVCSSSLLERRRTPSMNPQLSRPRRGDDLPAGGGVGGRAR